MNKKIPKWKIEVRGGGQIADTGDYGDPLYVLTNGEIELVTRNELDEEEISHIENSMNSMDARWEDWKLSDKEFELSIANKEIESLQKWRQASEALYGALKDLTDKGHLFVDREAHEKIDKSMEMYEQLKQEEI